MAMKNPCHPGVILREDFIVPMGLQIKDVAERIGVTRTALSRIVNERAGLSSDMALRLEKAFGWKADLWIRLQASYDLAQSRQHEDEITRDIEPFKVNAA